MRVSKLADSDGKAVLFLVGTRAEVIKIKPVITRLSSHGVPVDLIWVGLHSRQAIDCLQHLLRNVYILDKSDEDKKTQIAVLSWFINANIQLQLLALNMVLKRKKLPLLLVHGDTLCTLMGAIFALTARIKSGHIEAAVRSGSLLRPFPEEISRRIVSHLVDIHFAPGDKEYAKAISYRGKSLNTVHNTSRDALYDDLSGVNFENLGYIVVTLHRTELLSDKEKLTEICLEIIELAKDYEVRWFVGGHEKSSLEKYGLLAKIEESAIRLHPRCEHSEFMEHFSKAHCVITDSGGLQSECHDLGIPVIVHRRESEYFGGPGSPWILTSWDINTIRHFLEGIKGASLERGKRYESVASDIICSEIYSQLKNS